MTKTGDTAQEIAALYATIVARKTADPADSYSAQLLADLSRAARKIGVRFEQSQLEKARLSRSSSSPRRAAEAARYRFTRRDERGAPTVLGVVAATRVRELAEDPR